MHQGCRENAKTGMVVPDSDKSPRGKPNQGRPTFWGSESLSLTCKSQAWEATVWVVVAVGRQRAITEHCRAHLGLPCLIPVQVPHWLRQVLR